MPNDVGYRRPPAETQFKKGKSGNPKGRPKGSKNFMTLLEHELAQKIVVNENGRRKAITRLQAMVKRMVASAMQGDQKQLLLLFEILRRSGGLEPASIEGLLPPDYETVLDNYIETQRRLRGPSKRGHE